MKPKKPQKYLTAIRARTPADEAIVEHIERVKQSLVKAIDADVVREAVKAQAEKARKGDRAALEFIIGLLGHATQERTTLVRMIDPPMDELPEEN